MGSTRGRMFGIIVLACVGLAGCASGTGSATVQPAPTARPTARPTVAALNTPLPSQGWVTVPELATMRNLAFARSDPLTGYACGATFMAVQTPADVLQLSVTRDGGRTWSATAPTTVPGASCDLFINPAKADDIVLQSWRCYLGGCNGATHYRSHDGGKTWVKLEFDATQWQTAGQVSGGQVQWSVSEPAWIGDTAYFAVIAAGAHGPMARPQHPLVTNTSGNLLSAMGDDAYAQVADTQSFPDSVWANGPRLVFRSEASSIPEAESADGGTTWQRFVPTLDAPSGSVGSFFFGDGAVASINGSLARSINGGKTWQWLPALPEAAGPGGINPPLRLFQAADGTILCTQIQTIWRLGPGATTWTNSATRLVDSYDTTGGVIVYSMDTSGRPVLVWAETSHQAVNGAYQPGLAYHALA